MNDYYIRCRAAEAAQLHALALALGVLAQDEDGVHHIDPGYAGAWDEVGPIHRPTGETDEEGMPVSAPVLDDAGVPYWHANLRINADLAEIAQALAPANPAIAAGLSDLSRWFVVGADGRAAAPKHPARVWL